MGLYEVICVNIWKIVKHSLPGKLENFQDHSETILFLSPHPWWLWIFLYFLFSFVHLYLVFRTEAIFNKRYLIVPKSLNYLSFPDVIGHFIIMQWSFSVVILSCLQVCVGWLVFIQRIFSHSLIYSLSLSLYFVCVSC